MICISCGLPISDKYHRTERGSVCNRCWNDDNLFFPEKIHQNGILTTLNRVYNLSNEHEKLTLPVIRLKQKDLVLYSGKMKANEVLNLYGVLSFNENGLSGYQRDLYENQTKELAKYLLECPIPILPGVLISIRAGAEFNQISDEYEDVGTLEVPIQKGAIWVIDGQHRIGGFEQLISNLFNVSESQMKAKVESMFDFELPVTFIDTKKALEVLEKDQKLNLSEPDIERLAFFIINKTQRRLSPSLKDTLQYVITRAGIRGIPTIEKEVWRTEGAAIGIDLNSLENSPFYNKINISGQRGLGRPFQLNSFVSSLHPLLRNEFFGNLSLQDKNNFLLQYWTIIKQNNEKAFDDKTYVNYLLLKTVGIYTLNLIALDFINATRKNDIIYDNLETMSHFITRMNGFDWKKETSPITAFSGSKGVIESRKILIEYMGHNNE